MRLDTAILIYAVASPERLSAMSLTEIAIKAGRGRLDVSKAQIEEAFWIFARGWHRLVLVSLFLEGLIQIRAFGESLPKSFILFSGHVVVKINFAGISKLNLEHAPRRVVTHGSDRARTWRSSLHTTPPPTTALLREQSLDHAVSRVQRGIQSTGIFPSGFREIRTPPAFAANFLRYGADYLSSLHSCG
jgi:hypothetical protein